VPLSYQISGWLTGETIFSSFNSEALLFTFLTGSLLVIGWLCFNADEYSPKESYWERTIFWSGIVGGLALGILFRVNL
jgi:hypothetical protein